MHRVIAIAFFMIVIWALPASSFASTQLPTTRSLTVILVDDLSLDDISSHEGLGRLAGNGYLGMVSSPTQGFASPEKYLYSLGAGKVAGSNWLPQGAFHVEERPAASLAGRLYVARGGDSPQAGSIVSLDIFVMKRLAASLAGKPAPGALGTALSDAGVRVRLFGNADVRDPDPDSSSVAFHREAAYFAMNSDGVIDSGDIRSPESWADAKTILSRSGITFVQLPYLQQLRDRFTGPPMSSIGPERLGALDDTHAAILSLVGGSRPDTIHLVMSPSPPIREQQHAGGAPIMILLPGGSGGIIDSLGGPTNGIVRSIDLAPTILAALNVEVPSYFPGSPAVLVDAKTSPESLARTEAMITERMLSRADLHELLAVVFIALIIGLTLSPLIPLRTSIFGTVLITVASGLLFLPLVALGLSSPLASSGANGYALLTVATSMVVGYLVYRFRSLLWLWTASFVIVLGILFSDLIAGTAISFDSLLSLSPLASTAPAALTGLIPIVGGLGIVLLPVFIQMAWGPEQGFPVARQHAPHRALVASVFVIAAVSVVSSVSGLDMGSALCISLPAGLLAYWWQRRTLDSTLWSVLAVGIGLVAVYVVDWLLPFTPHPISTVSIPQLPLSPIFPGVLAALLAIWWLIWRYSWPDSLSRLLEVLRPSLVGLGVLLLVISVWLPGRPYYYVIVIGLFVCAMIVAQYSPVITTPKKNAQ